MSNNNNKNYHNYQNYQNKKNNNHNSRVEENKVPEKKEVQEESIHSIMDDYEANALTEEAKVEEPKTITGVVVDCPRLRVRAAANKNAEVLCEINVGSKVLISEKESTNEFYKVCTEAGVEGYCMKQFIGIE